MVSTVKKEFEDFIAGKSVVIWGTGNTASLYIDRFDIQPLYFICNYADENAALFHGKPVYSPAKLLSPDDSVFVLIASLAHNEIAVQLEKMKFTQPKNYIDAESLFNLLMSSVYIRNRNINLKFEISFPGVEEFKRSLLSVLQVRGEDNTAWYEVAEILQGDLAELCLSLTHEKQAEKLLQRNNTILNYISIVAVLNVCSKKLGIRLSPTPSFDPYIFYSILKGLIDCCFPDYKSKITYLSFIAETEVFSRFRLTCAYSLIAQTELDNDNIESAAQFICKAFEIDPSQLFVNHLYYNILIAAKDTGLNLPYPDELSDFFCTIPFDDYSFNNFEFNKRNVFSFICPCNLFSQVTVEGAGGWNCEERKKFRMSIHDGSYFYCNRFYCPFIVSKTLPKKDDITDVRYRNIIDNKLAHIPDIKAVDLTYDSACNLKCHICRSSILSHSEDEIRILNDFADTEILPLVQSANILRLSGTGEALFSKHSLYLLKKLTPKKYPGLRIEITTNAAHNLEKVWYDIGDTASLIKHVRVSIDGSNQETFEKLRYPGKFHILNKNMEFLKELKSKKKLSELHVNFVVQADNYTQMTDMLQLCISWNVCCIHFSRIAMTDVVSQESNVFCSEHPSNKDLENEILRLENEIARGLPFDVRLNTLISNEYRQSIDLNKIVE